MIVLGIETSCDDTSAAILKEENGIFSILSNTVSSQIKLHSAWGGVVPNLAAREHLKNILPVIEETFRKAKIQPRDIDLISVTNGPGLIPALLIGTSTSKTLSYLWNKPLIGIHHIEGHIYANFVEKVESRKSKVKNNETKFPFLCLVVSGGHTQLVLMKKHLNYEIIGETLDDAAGEAFDKVARILNLDYPGGPIVAQKALINKSYKLKATLPRPIINSNNFNFSFSGLKTAVLYLVKKNEKEIKNEEFISAVCREFQQAVIDVLVSKTIKAAQKFKPKTIMLAGGVSANIELRKQLGEKIKNELGNIAYKIPDINYCVDNASMIAMAGFFRWKENKNKKSFQEKIKNNWRDLETNANLKLK